MTPKLTFDKLLKQLLFVILIVFTLSACQNSTAEETGEIIYIDSKTVDCEGVMPQKCLLVKESKEADWSYFYDQIEGFQYEPGYSYTLLVKITTIDNPPQDASSRHYQLIKVLEQNCDAY